MQAAAREDRVDEFDGWEISKIGSCNGDWDSRIIFLEDAKYVSWLIKPLKGHVTLH